MKSSWQRVPSSRLMGGHARPVCSNSPTPILRTERFNSYPLPASSEKLSETAMARKLKPSGETITGQSIRTCDTHQSSMAAESCSGSRFHWYSYIDAGPKKLQWEIPGIG